MDALPVTEPTISKHWRMRQTNKLWLYSRRWAQYRSLRHRVPVVVVVGWRRRLARGQDDDVDAERSSSSSWLRTAPRRVARGSLLVPRDGRRQPRTTGSFHDRRGWHGPFRTAEDGGVLPVCPRSTGVTRSPTCRITIRVQCAASTLGLACCMSSGR